MFQTNFVYLESIKFYLNLGGRSRGSYIVTENILPEDTVTGKSGFSQQLCMYDKDVEKRIIEVGLRDGSVRIKLEEVREIPEQDLWFEKVWKEYLEDIYLD
jgi:hypothetical protein